MELMIISRSHCEVFKRHWQVLSGELLTFSCWINHIDDPADDEKL